MHAFDPVAMAADTGFRLVQSFSDRCMAIVQLTVVRAAHCKSHRSRNCFFSALTWVAVHHLLPMEFFATRSLPFMSLQLHEDKLESEGELFGDAEPDVQVPASQPGTLPCLGEPPDIPEINLGEW